MSLLSPLGHMVATSPLFKCKLLDDGASVAGLLLVTVYCLGGNESAKRKYDRMMAHNQFLNFFVQSSRARFCETGIVSGIVEAS